VTAVKGSMAYNELSAYPAEGGDTHEENQYIYVLLEAREVAKKK